jgi:hypothetical protein
MSRCRRVAVAKGVVANIAAVGVLAVGAAVATSAPAAAEPPPEIPVDPAVPAPPLGLVPPLSAVGGTLAQTGAPAGPGGLPDLSFIGTTSLLAQAPVPEAPGGPPGTPPPSRALNNGYLLPQNIVPSAPGQGTVFGVDPGNENADITGIEYLKRLHSSYREGGLDGALLGRRPVEQLGEPLPGTAPPPGTAIPPGLGGDLPVPPPILPPPPPAG